MPHAILQHLGCRGLIRVYQSYYQTNTPRKTSPSVISRRDNSSLPPILHCNCGWSTVRQRRYNSTALHRLRTHLRWIPGAQFGRPAMANYLVAKRLYRHRYASDSWCNRDFAILTIHCRQWSGVRACGRNCRLCHQPRELNKELIASDEEAVHMTMFIMEFHVKHQLRSQILRHGQRRSLNFPRRCWEYFGPSRLCSWREIDPSRRTGILTRT